MDWLILVLVAVVLYFLFMRKGSGYADIVTSAQETIKSLFELPVSLECTSGPGLKAAYYSTERPGGICGDQEQIKSAMRDYTIDDGIGGSLLEK